MTYGELKRFALQLLNQYSVAGKEIPLTYNNQADLDARIPALVRDGLHYLATSTRRLRAAVELAAPEQMGQILVYDLPHDCYQVAGGLLRMDGQGQVQPFQNFRVVGGRQIWIDRQWAGRFWLEYFRYPMAPEGTPGEDEFLDCPPEAQTALAYYVAAHLAMEDNNFLYGTLYNEFERKLARLQEGIVMQGGVTQDAYGAMGE